MKNSTISRSKIKPESKTDWKRVVGKIDSEVIRDAKSDPECGILSNKKYYKPERSGK
jgi:hypothetical protein